MPIKINRISLLGKILFMIKIGIIKISANDIVKSVFFSIRDTNFFEFILSYTYYTDFRVVFSMGLKRPKALFWHISLLNV